MWRASGEDYSRRLSVTTTISTTSGARSTNDIAQKQKQLTIHCTMEDSIIKGWLNFNHETESDHDSNHSEAIATTHTTRDKSSVGKKMQ